MNSRILTRLVTTVALTLLLLPVAAAQSAGADADPIVVRVGSNAERLSDFNWRYAVAIRNVIAQQGMPYSEELARQLDALKPTFLEQRAQEMALVVAARDRGFVADEERMEEDLAALRGSVETDEEYELILAGAGFADEANLRTLLAEADIVNQLIDGLQADAEANVTDATLRARYLAERSQLATPESYCAKHILVPEVEVAEELLARIGAGEAFEDLAAEYGTDGTRSVGGDLGCFGPGQMVAPFEDAVRDAPVGEAVGPIETQFGQHLILVYDRQPATVPSFDEVASELRRYVASLEVDAVINSLITNAGVVTYPDRLGLE